MKLTYKNQILIAIGVIILFNVLETVFRHWIFRSIGFVICGLLWIIHPALPDSMEVTPKMILWVRIMGVILILIGIFTRVYVE